MARSLGHHPRHESTKPLPTGKVRGNNSINKSCLCPSSPIQTKRHHIDCLVALSAQQVPHLEYKRPTLPGMPGRHRAALDLLCYPLAGFAIHHFSGSDNTALICPLFRPLISIGKCTANCFNNS